jgi:hypothetical protein
MKSSVTKTFRKHLNDLPASVQEQAAKAYALWQEDPYYPSLQLNESASDNRFTLSVSALTTVFSAYWNLTIFTGIGLAHMMSMMNCLIGCRMLDRWRSLPEVIGIEEHLYILLERSIDYFV